MNITILTSRSFLVHASSSTPKIYDYKNVIYVVDVMNSRKELLYSKSFTALGNFPANELGDIVKLTDRILLPPTKFITAWKALLNGLSYLHENRVCPGLYSVSRRDSLRCQTQIGVRKRYSRSNVCVIIKYFA